MSYAIEQGDAPRRFDVCTGRDHFLTDDLLKVELRGTQQIPGRLGDLLRLRVRRLRVAVDDAGTCVEINQ